MQHKRTAGGYAHVVILVIVAIAIMVIAFALFNIHRTAAKPTPQAADLSSNCVGRTFTTGSSGHCVGDIQTLVNYMEHSGLTECQFTGSAQLDISSTYDNATVQQVKSVQDWARCYARQEGFTSNVQQTGTVDKATWGELCTYGYTNPSRNGATGAAGSITAGKDAGCAQLQQS